MCDETGGLWRRCAALSRTAIGAAAGRFILGLTALSKRKGVIAGQLQRQVSGIDLNYGFAIRDYADSANNDAHFEVRRGSTPNFAPDTGSGTIRRAIGFASTSGGFTTHSCTESSFFSMTRPERRIRTGNPSI